MVTVGGTGFGAGAVEVATVGAGATGEIGAWGSRAGVTCEGAGTVIEGFFLAAPWITLEGAGTNDVEVGAS